MISAGPVCPNCKQTIFSDDWTGLVVVIDPANSEVARLMGIKVPGLLLSVISKTARAADPSLRSPAMEGHDRAAAGAFPILQLGYSS